MSTATEPVSEPAAGSVGEAHHITCCSNRVALCGTDTTGMRKLTERPPDAELCAPCRWVDAAMLPCPVEGCGHVDWAGRCRGCGRLGGWPLVSWLRDRR